MQYVPLRIVSHYSVLKSIIQPKALLEYAKEQGFPVIALTDINNLFAGAEFSFAARACKYPAILGCTVQTSAGVVTLYCKNANGYKNLCNLLSDLNMIYAQVLPLEKLREYSGDLICVTGNVDGVLKEGQGVGRGKELQILHMLREVFGEDFFLELNRTNGRAGNEMELAKWSKEYGVPVVGTSVAYFLSGDHAAAYQAMQAIGSNEIMVDENKMDGNTGRLLTAKEMYEKFSDCPIVLENTLALAKKCTFLLEQQKPRFASFAKDESTLLRQWAQEGLLDHFKDPSWFALIADRYVGIEEAKKVYQERLDYELDMIIKLGFAGYFLIVADFVSWARGQKISLSARGSGAGSLVAWALKIIVIDPIYFGLFFERFINPGRVSLPDFDIDFCQQRREEVIDYVTKKYTKDFVAHIITFGMWHSRGVLRDVGRVLNLPYKMVDHFCKLIPNKPNFSLTLSEALDFDASLKEQYTKDDKIKRLFDISMQLEGNNRSIGTHAAGIVIGWDRLRNLIPLYWTDEMQLPATGYTMKYIEQASLVKFDFLGLTALTIIDKTILLLGDEGSKIDIQHIDIKDQKIFELLCKGLTAGIFQFESVGLTNTIKKLQPTTIDELIAIISLYRPGPMENIDLYISNKRDISQIEYIFEDLADILKETFGIIIYQEQVISIAKVLANYTLSEADILRRAMGKKNPQEMKEQRDKFTLNIIMREYEKKYGVKLTYEQIREMLDNVMKDKEEVVKNEEGDMEIYDDSGMEMEEDIEMMNGVEKNGRDGGDKSCGMIRRRDNDVMMVIGTEFRSEEESNFERKCLALSFKIDWKELDKYEIGKGRSEKIDIVRLNGERILYLEKKDREISDSNGDNCSEVDSGSGISSGNDDSGNNGGNGKKKRKSVKTDNGKGEKYNKEEVEFVRGVFDKATDLFDQIVKFSGYAFNKAHAVSHTFIGYQTAYLKVYYTLEFMAVSLSMEQDKHEKIELLYQELSDLNLEMLGPDVNKSTTVFEVCKPNKILYSLACVKSMGNVLVEEIIKERGGSGLIGSGVKKYRPFKSVEELCKRVRLSQTTIEALIFSGALDKLKIWEYETGYDNGGSACDATRYNSISGSVSDNENAESNASVVLAESTTVKINKIAHRSSLYNQIENLLGANGSGIFSDIGCSKADLTVQELLLKEYKYMGILLSRDMLKTIIEKKAEVVLSTDLRKMSSSSGGTKAAIKEGVSDNKTAENMSDGENTDSHEVKSKKNWRKGRDSKEVYISGLLLDKQIVKTKKNTIQYILKVADMGSVFEVFAGEEMWEMAGVREGDVIICQIMVRNQYWIAEKIFPQTHTIRNVYVNVNTQTELMSVKKWTEGLMPGATKCILKINSNGNVKNMALNSYHISQQELEKLLKDKIGYEINVD